MIFDLLSGDITSALMTLILVIPTVLMALTFHEFAHGWMANKLGDPTAKVLGRLTLNPLKHLDLFGTLAMLVAGFGWAKPVPVNTRYFKKPKRDMALTAAAGPIMNFTMSFIGLVLYAVCYLVLPNVMIADAALTFFYYFAFLNAYLALFNLIPVPPFDGSRIFYVFLPQKFYWGVMKHERQIMIITLIILVALSRFDLNPMSYIVEAYINGVLTLFIVIINLVSTLIHSLI